MRNLKPIKIDLGEPDVLMGQSIVLGENKAETPLHSEKLFESSSSGNSTWNELNHFHQKAK